ncbi:MAG: peptidoglycan DD-metalloendopeptidase family protein [Pseudoxanthomonas suwonensis]|nr:peptidoglycan DD-metalloendopeptidase family protein [Pseudoxanthomonas suwonensis]
MIQSVHEQLQQLRQRALALGGSLCGKALRNPGSAAAGLLVLGLGVGVGLNSLATASAQAREQAKVAASEQQLKQTQREINAMSARLGELQAQANRLNALGERLARSGELEDGEFDFGKPVPQGGVGPTRDISAEQLHHGLDRLDAEFARSGEQLAVMESLLFNRELERSLLPSRAPVARSYITSGFGGRADPFGNGGQFHRGIDFNANHGDPVLAVADGVVSYAGTRGGYGMTIEVDHGNGYVTRLAHNSRLSVRVGDLVRTGQEVAKAGSTGRSTGVHVHFEVWKDGNVVNPRPFLEGDAPQLARR